MTVVEKIDECNKERFIKHIGPDVIKHVFALYDVQHDPEHTTIHAVFEKNDLRGYVLLYTGTEVPSIILECEEEIAETLIGYAPKDHFVIHAPPSMLRPVKRRFPNAKIYVENWMLIRKENAKFVSSKLVKRLTLRKTLPSLRSLFLAEKTAQVPT